MIRENPSIYRARNLQEAYLLRNLLEEEGIRATVSNEVLQNGSGVDIVGWPTLPQVTVAEEDAERAREVFLEFDRNVSAGQAFNLSSGTENNSRQIFSDRSETYPAVWPCCPECGKRRLTRCKFCGTSGSDFPSADAEAVDILGLPTPPAGENSNCGCGPDGCGTHRAEADPSFETSVSASTTPLLICPTCDEPFRPDYLRRCEWCGHEFLDGVEITLPEKKPSEPVNWRIAYVLYVFTLLAIGLAAYLRWLF